MSVLKPSPAIRNGVARLNTDTAPSTLSHASRCFSQSLARAHDSHGPSVAPRLLFPKQQHSDDVLKLARLANDARHNDKQLAQLLTETDPALDQAKAYRVAAAICHLRMKEGERPIGRKIGFTNRDIWPEYDIDASNWSYIYNTTKQDIRTDCNKQSSQPVNILEMSNLEPRLEPEIILHVAKKPNSGMTDVQMLGCVDWVSHGFEIVQSIFPGWKFSAADTTAAFALHGRLLVGAKVPVAKLGASSEDVVKRLETFKISLSRNGNVVDQGSGAHVLGSPLEALRHLCGLLEQDEHNAPLVVGETVTTGTLTRAWELQDGEVWSTEVEGIDLPGLKQTFRVRD
ncbi:hydratase [Teratosphaeria destructans]|uniref:Hydratase n=1 Tax=Teratosphaeria destructans TaxID=418781 RepID=A0A9W7W3X0_9PEZI|nr:hydratase [Teratosphaeria destructans]